MVAAFLQATQTLEALRVTQTGADMDKPLDCSSTQRSFSSCMGTFERQLLELSNTVENSPNGPQEPAGDATRRRIEGGMRRIIVKRPPMRLTGVITSLRSIVVTSHHGHGLVNDWHNPARKLELGLCSFALTKGLIRKLNRYPNCSLSPSLFLTHGCYPFCSHYGDCTEIRALHPDTVRLDPGIAGYA